ncbi:MAG: hypothetical protein KDA25_13070 [Phycisphaerales bacterium]|nr:hypothetical protein [Phycisphaerales bacterium]
MTRLATPSRPDDFWRCPRCAESVESTFVVCWNCGTTADGRMLRRFTPEVGGCCGEGDPNALATAADVADVDPRLHRLRRRLFITWMITWFAGPAIMIALSLIRVPDRYAIIETIAFDLWVVGAILTPALFFYHFLPHATRRFEAAHPCHRGGCGCAAAPTPPGRH